MVAKAEATKTTIVTVLTNQYFTAPAVEAAKKLKILLWDRGYLEEMIAEETTACHKDN